MSDTQSPAASGFVGGTLPTTQSAAATGAIIHNIQTAATAAKQHHGFVRWVDAVGGFFKAHGKVIADDAIKVGVEVEPLLALTPFGPEWDIAMNAIVKVQADVENKNLSNAQKFETVTQDVGGDLSAILKAKGITETAQQQLATQLFIQAVFGIAAGPAVPGNIVQAGLEVAAGVAELEHKG